MYHNRKGRSMKNILIAGPADDPFRIPQLTKAAVEASGGQVFFSMDPSDLAACDGVILPGGLPDIDPANYGERNTACNMIDSELDNAQLKMLDTSVALEKPILGICRGHQLLNVYFGGTLLQDVAELEVHRFVPDAETLHDSVCVPGTPLYQLYGAEGLINTKHHQAIKKVAKNFQIAQLWFAPGISEQRKKNLLSRIQNNEQVDGTDWCMVEAIVHRSKPMLGLQWHPEHMIASPSPGTVDPKKLFNYFIALL